MHKQRQAQPGAERDQHGLGSLLDDEPEHADRGGCQRDRDIDADGVARAES